VRPFDAILPDVLHLYRFSALKRFGYKLGNQTEPHVPIART